MMALGMDYERKRVSYGNLVDVHLSEPEVREELLKDLADIVPLHDREVVKIRPHGDISVTSNRFKAGLSFVSFLMLYHIFVK